MNQITIESPNKGNLKITYPNSWSEITLGQLIRLEKLGIVDPLTVFSILTGLEYDFAAGLDAKLEPVVWDMVSFIFKDQPKWDLVKPPSHLVLSGIPYKIPKIDKATLGQSVMFTGLVAQTKTLFDFVPKVIALYFQPLVHGGKFDREKLDDIERMVMNTSAVDAMGVANFFLKRPKQSAIITRLGSHLLSPTRLRRSLTMVPLRSLVASSGLTR